MKNHKIILEKPIVNCKSKIVNLKFKIAYGLAVLRSYGLTVLLSYGLLSCGDWLDVVPEGTATIDMAFNSRTQALKFLGNCYYYMPGDASSANPALWGSDELFSVPTNFIVNTWGYSATAMNLARGMQSAANPLCGGWDRCYQGLRVCNTFLENVVKVPDLPSWEREQWIAEAKVLKAYYHFYLVRMYGPVPLVRENIPVSANVSAVKTVREPVDECFRYIVELLDEACAGEMLPSYISDEANDLGRITTPIAKSLKAKVLVTAASPLFNGNNDQATLRNRDGTPLFNANEDPAKWQKAAEACREAIEACNDADIRLFEYPNIRYTDAMATDMTLRNAFSLRWNSEIIWANTTSLVNTSNGGLIRAAMPILNSEYAASNTYRKFIAVPLKMVSLFYTKHGVPIDEDKTLDISKIYDIRTAVAEEALYIRQGRISLNLHFDREPRFYAYVGFDGGVWFGAGMDNDLNPSSLRYLGFKMGETDGDDGQGLWTGYIPKKFIPVGAQFNGINSFSAINYPWPVMRLSDLYLLYAEAINEAEGPNDAHSDEMFEYLRMVRKRAGLDGVKESWDAYTDNTKYNTKEGMRQIIQQERMIELCFEGQRFWDIRRWKIAPDIYRTPIEGWNKQVSIIDGTESEYNRMFYTPQLLLQQSFSVRDYFWPISNNELEVNPNLVQNIGW